MTVRDWLAEIVNSTDGYGESADEIIRQVAPTVEALVTALDALTAFNVREVQPSSLSAHQWADIMAAAQTALAPFREDR